MGERQASGSVSGLVSQRFRPILLIAVLTLSTVLAWTTPARPAAAETIPAPASGIWSVHGHGLGHGHGLSQYGARGAATAVPGRAAHTAAQIIAFYYPGTSLTRLSQPMIRVRITDDGGATTASVRPGQTLTLTWPGGSASVTASTASRARLVAVAGGRVQAQLLRTAWVNWGAPMPASAVLTSSAGYVRLLQSSGSVDLRGSVGTVFDSGLGRITVNRLPLDSYVQGVVPREMPASWQSAAVQAQAIAARSYARYAVEHSGGASSDICDSTNCQVYGGRARYDGAGSLLYAEDPAANQAVAATSNLVATYAGATIFAQFSASDGGWTSAGGQPYLAARADPYEAASGDPYLNWTSTVRTADVASYYGLARVSQIAITGRDGHGEWGGRIRSATVTGVDGSGRPASVNTSGFALTAAMGLRHEWFHVDSAPPAAPPAAPTAVTAASADAAALVSWRPPTVAGSDPITGYSVAVAGMPAVIVGSASRSTWIGDLRNGTRYTATVRALNSAGAGAAATVVLAPAARPQQVQVVTPARLFDTRLSHTAVVANRPLVAGLGGHGSIPSSGVSAVQLAVTIVAPTANGALRVYNDGSPVNGTAAIAYRAGVTSTATVSVPLTTSGRVAFRPTAGAMNLIADQISYSTAAAARLTATSAVLILDSTRVGSGAGRVLGLGGAVPAQATAVVLQLMGSTAGTGGYLRVWSGTGPVPVVSQLSVPARSRRVNTVIVPIGPNRSVRVAASNASLGGQISVVGYTAPTGALLETVPVTGTADTVARVAADLTVSRAGSRVLLAGRPQLPAAGVSAVLLHITVTAASANSQLRVYADGAAPPRAVTVALLSGVPTTTTVLVPVSAGGAVRLVTDGSTARVALDVTGYLTGH
jgi:SpoIID/LytB domain protein